MSYRERQILYDITYMPNKKNKVQMNLFMKQKHAQRTNYSYQVGEVGGIDWEIEIDMNTWLYLKYITNKDLLYSIRTLLGILQ